MSNVLVEKNKLDILANAISNKSGEPLTLTLDEMVEAVDGIEQGIQPSGNINITQAGQTDVTNYATATVPQGEIYVNQPFGRFKTVSNVRKWEVVGSGGIIEGDLYGHAGYVADETWETVTNEYNAVPSGTTITPSTSAQTIGGANYMMEGAVTVNAMPRASFGIPTNNTTIENGKWNYTRSYPNFSAGYLANHPPVEVSISLEDKTVTPSASQQVITPTDRLKYLNSVTVSAMPSGTAGTPTATKGTVTGHSVSITPSVTNTSGFISGGTITGTAVNVSASELVSGNLAITENGTGIDVANYSTVSVDVSGGGSSGVQVGVGTPMTGTNTMVMFGDILGTPTSFSLICTYDIAVGTAPLVSAIAYDGTNYIGQAVTNTSNANASYISTGMSHTYDSSNHTIAINSTSTIFDTYSRYILVYSYGGSSSDVHTSDVQVGSGATSITFPVVGNPIYWSCVFKSNFGTSSGYQRVIAVGNFETTTYGLCLDSSAHASNQYWTASYSGGNLTISSQGTNAGGYFHQPGYYQLTYIVDESAPSYQTKTVTPTTSQQVVSPDSGFDALSQVTVNAIPSQYIIPSGNINITSNTASGQTLNVSQYATATVNVSGGGGSSTCDTKTMTNSNDQATSIQFTGLSGEPKWFFVRCAAQMSRSSSYSYYYITAVRYNGTNHYGNYWRRSNGTFYNDTTHYSHTYSNGTLTVSSSASRGAAGGSFYNGSYELVYIY